MQAEKSDGIPAATPAPRAVERKFRRVRRKTGPGLLLDWDSSDDRSASVVFDELVILLARQRIIDRFDECIFIKEVTRVTISRTGRLLRFV